MNLTLQTTFKAALELYHKEGLHNGGGVDGVQLPPGVPEAALDTFIDKLSTFLAQQPGMDVKAPAAGQSEAEFRHATASEVASTVAAHSHAYIDTAVSLIQNPVIAAMVRQALEQAPPQFFTAKAVEGGPFHPPDELTPGGLTLHSLRDVLMGIHVIDFYNQEAEANGVGNQKIENDERDLLLGGLILHDVAKGSRWDMAHGPTGADFLRQVWHDHPNQAFAAAMADMVENHMAQWNRNTDGDRDPRPPKTLRNQIVSYGDYLGSLPRVFVQPFPGQDE